MKFRASQRLPFLVHKIRASYINQQRFLFTSFNRKAQTVQARAFVNGGSGSSSNSQGNYFLVPGATVATLAMLAALHARRLYNDKKIEDAKEKGIEFEFQPDVKATFLRFLPLRSISRFFGLLANVEYPIWLRPYVYRAWARAFHSNLEEAAMPLDQYTSLRAFFVRTLKEGSRPIDPDPFCLVSPVDGTVLRFGELKEAGALIEQVKGFSYSASSLLGARSLLPMIDAQDMQDEGSGQDNDLRDEQKKSWWRISLASPKVRDPAPASPMKGLFYCVIYLKPGDYHRVHSPADWNILARRHFPGVWMIWLRKWDFGGWGGEPRVMQEMKHKDALVWMKSGWFDSENGILEVWAVILRVVQERRHKDALVWMVVLEGRWKEGFMAMAAIGATNIGSIELFTEPDLRTNRPRKKLLQTEPPEERIYEHEGMGVMLKKGDEVAAFNMGSTVVLVFQAPSMKLPKVKGLPSEFNFCIRRGDRIRMGEALGRWHDS
ncbi:hypothetical protein RJ640_012875 [Escallonia rubra]|uniref:Phosphatidylserine decarboxylase proenzyme 1, mitochondrial n=1 Tax=Escallonia rubra TaxID=112253 RepID=A0AA88RIH3_9ASTE|nr:hypothetical protein RJ640_012875 [Escallonia rubra]